MVRFSLYDIILWGYIFIGRETPNECAKGGQLQNPRGVGCPVISWLWSHRNSEVDFQPGLAAPHNLVANFEFNSYID